MKLIKRSYAIKYTCLFYSLLFSALTPVFHPFAIIAVFLALIAMFGSFSNLNYNAFDKFMFKLNTLTTGYLWNKLSKGDLLVFETYFYPSKDTRNTKRMVVQVLEKTKYHVTLKCSGDDLRTSDYSPINITTTVDSYTFTYKFILYWSDVIVKWNGKLIKVLP